MAKRAKGLSVTSNEYQLTGLSESEAKQAAGALRIVLSGARRVSGVRGKVERANVAPLTVVTGIVARFMLAALSHFPQVTDGALVKLVKEARRTVNASIVALFSASSKGSAKSQLSKIHRPITHPATVAIGQLWASNQYGAAIPAASGDGVSEATLSEATRRCAAADKPSTPEGLATKWLRQQANKASNPRAFYAMISACVENLLAEETPAKAAAQA